MRVKLLLAGLLMLLPLPAFADVTATYTAGEKDHLIVEVDSGGNARASLGDKFAIIRIDGVDYLAVSDATGNYKVTRMADMVEMMAGQMKGMGGNASVGGVDSMTFELRAGGEESLSGYGGMMWFFGPKPEPGKTPQKQLEFVMSGDAALAPIGGFFRHIYEVASPMIEIIFGSGSGNFAPLSAELVTKGTPIRIGPVIKLESVATTEIAASRFELPGPVLEPMEFLQDVSPSDGAGLSPLP